MKLGALILQLYKSLGEELPNRVNWLEKIFSANIPIIQGYIEQTENYTVELKHILESNGWFRSRQTHPAWEKIEYNFSNEVVLFLHRPPRSDLRSLSPRLHPHDDARVGGLTLHGIVPLLARRV